MKRALASLVKQVPWVPHTTGIGTMRGKCGAEVMPAEAMAVPITVGEVSGVTGLKRMDQVNDNPAWSNRGRMIGGSTRRVDDSVLIREAQSGDRAAFEELVRQYDQAVLRLALHLTGSEADAQDIYQDAFLKAYRSLGKFRFECSFYTWLYRIVTNLCLDQLRKRNVRKEDSAVMTDSDGEEYSVIDQVSDDRAGANPEHDLMRRELGGKIQKALEKL